MYMGLTCCQTGYVRRADELANIKSLLCPVAGQPVPSRLLLCGPIGVGKTSLAAALCLEEAVISQFPAGVCWLRVGNSPNIAQLQQSLYRRLLRTSAHTSLSGRTDQERLLELRAAAAAKADAVLVVSVLSP